MKISIDFDGVIVEREGIPRFTDDLLKSKPKEGALEAINWLISNDHEVYICTAREVWEWASVAEWLKQHHFPYLRITNIKELNTTIFLDDRAVRFTNWMDFTKLIG